MARKKSKTSVYNNAGKTVDASIDGTRSVPKMKKSMYGKADSKTFSTKTKGLKNGKSK